MCRSLRGRPLTTEQDRGVGTCARLLARFVGHGASSAVILGLVLLGGSVAVAAIPNGNTITACRNTKTGALRVIDPTIGAKCAPGEALLSWNHWNWRNTWLSTIHYRVADVVSYRGASYIGARGAARQGRPDQHEVLEPGRGQGRDRPSGTAGNRRAHRTGRPPRASGPDRSRRCDRPHGTHRPCRADRSHRSHGTHGPDRSDWTGRSRRRPDLRQDQQ